MTPIDAAGYQHENRDEEREAWSAARKTVGSPRSRDRLPTARRSHERLQTAKPVRTRRAEVARRGDGGRCDGLSSHCSPSRPLPSPKSLPRTHPPRLPTLRLSGPEGRELFGVDSPVGRVEYRAGTRPARRRDRPHDRRLRDRRRRAPRGRRSRRRDGGRQLPPLLRSVLVPPSLHRSSRWRRSPSRRRGREGVRSDPGVKVEAALRRSRLERSREPSVRQVPHALRALEPGAHRAARVDDVGAADRRGGVRRYVERARCCGERCSRAAARSRTRCTGRFSTRSRRTPRRRHRRAQRRAPASSGRASRLVGRGRRTSLRSTRATPGTTSAGSTLLWRPHERVELSWRGGLRRGLARRRRPVGTVRAGGRGDRSRRSTSSAVTSATIRRRRAAASICSTVGVTWVPRLLPASQGRLPLR